MVEALGIDMKEMLFAVVNFLILMGILTKFLYKPFLAMLDARKQSIAEAYEHADAVNKRADEKMSQYEKRIAGAEQEARDIVKDAKIKADKQAAQIVDEAGEKANKLMQKAEAEIERQKQLAIEDARSQIAELAVMAAEKIIEKEIDASGQTQIIDNILEEAGRSEWQS